MKNYILGLGFLLGLSLVSCGQDEIFNEQAQLETDIRLIDEYLAENALEADTILPSEIRVIIDERGAEPLAAFGSSVEANYIGYLLDGTEFDSNEGRGPFAFIVDRRDVIRGWELGIKVFGQGGSGTMLIPSGLAYGNTRRQGIPANSVLIFDIEVLSLR
jgi:FKBP-type peptidyl-prolyl cis-trans isomerase FkpA